MTKKFNKEDIKKSEKSALIWLISISAAALLIIVGIMLAKDRKENTPPQIPENSIEEQKTPQTKETDNKEPNKNAADNSKTGSTQNQKTEENTEQKTLTTIIDMETTKGNIKIVLENSKMPKTVQNFLKLINEKFYNGITFHRVEDWLIQGGDPTATGKGGSKETVPFEVSPDLTHKRGAIGMARVPNDLDSATSQFYIVKKDMHVIDGQYAIFGNVSEGMDVVDKIEIGDKIISVKIQK